MSKINWDIEESQEDIPRSLTPEEINNITSTLKFNHEQTIVQDNLIEIHRKKTAEKLAKIKIKPSKIQQLRQIIIEQFYKSMIATGEAVGINAAQCIGEPTTQLTLNSVAPFEKLFIMVNNTVQIVKIGEWIDTILLEHKNKIIHIPENRTEYLELSSIGINAKILSPDEKGCIKWDNISAVTRHLPVGNLVKIRTSYGRTATVTQNKSLLVWNGQYLVEKNGSDIEIGDKVPVLFNVLNTIENKPFDNLKGELYGLYYCYGYENYFTGSFNILKRIQDICINLKLKFDCPDNIYIKKEDWIFDSFDKNINCVFNNSNEFIKGFLKAIFSKFGTINDKNGTSLVFNFNNQIEAYTFGLLFNYIGIFFDLVQEKDYIIISIYNQNCVKWCKLIGSSDVSHNKLMKKCIDFASLNNVKTIQDIVLDPIIFVEHVSPTEYVYDLTVPRTKNFSLYNGLCVRDTFHSTGISAKNVTLGFPRARELFNATKSQSNPSCTIYFLKDNDSPEKLHKYTDKLPEAIIDELLMKNGYTVFEPENYVYTTWQNVWCKLNNREPELSEDEWVLRLNFNIEKLYEHNITIKEISKKLETNYSDIYCIPSPLNLGIIDIVVNCAEINLSTSRTNEFSDITDTISARSFYMNNIVSPKIRGLQCCGITGITKIYYRYADVDETFGGFPLKAHISNRLKSKKEWIAETDGTNLSEILCQNGVDQFRTMSNDMWEIYSILGIEAARRYLFLEFMNIAKNGGISINPVHFEILVSKMTYTGAIRAITRFGVETLQYGPIARATFEEVMSQLVTSSVFSETDQLNGISSNIVLGTRINAGTGIVHLDTIPLRVVKDRSDSKS
jgi:DNA-directed RNA polymerase beta' subunit